MLKIDNSNRKEKIDDDGRLCFSSAFLNLISMMGAYAFPFEKPFYFLLLSIFNFLTQDI